MPLTVAFCYTSTTSARSRPHQKVSDPAGRAHDRYKLRETREALGREREANGRNLVTNAHNWRWEMAELQNNLMVLP
jgi:hypothetical protein